MTISCLTCDCDARHWPEITALSLSHKVLPLPIMKLHLSKAASWLTSRARYLGGLTGHDTHAYNLPLLARCLKWFVSRGKYSHFARIYESPRMISDHLDDRPARVDSLTLSLSIPMCPFSIPANPV